MNLIPIQKYYCKIEKLPNPNKPGIFLENCVRTQVPFLLVPWHFASPDQQQEDHWQIYNRQMSLCLLKVNIKLPINCSSEFKIGAHYYVRYKYTPFNSESLCGYWGDIWCLHHAVTSLLIHKHITMMSHNERDDVSNHQPHDCLLNRLFRRRSKKTSKLRVTGDRWIPRTDSDSDSDSLFTAFRPQARTSVHICIKVSNKNANTMAQRASNA